jgi:hypothetical protein
MVLPTPKQSVAYTAKCREFCLIAGGRYPLHVYEQKDQDDYAVRSCHQINDSLTLEAGTLCPILSSMASRSVKLDGSQLSADAVRVHLIADRFKDIPGLASRTMWPFPNWMENDLVEYSDGTQHR